MLHFNSFTTHLIGSWPRRKEVLMAMRKHRKGQLPTEDFTALIEKDTAHVVQLQEAAGLDVLVSGELDRDNYSSFVADHLGGVRLMTMTEIMDYIDDKKAFENILNILDVPAISIRNAICVNKLVYHPFAVDELLRLKSLTNKPVKITLPGPYLLTRSMWVPNLTRPAYASKEELGQDVVALMIQEIDALQAIGVDIIQIDEPVLTEVVFTEGKPRSFMCAALSEKKDTASELAFASSLLQPVFDHIDRKRSLASLHVCRGNWSNDESILLTGPYTPLVNLFKVIAPDLLTLEFSTPRAGELSALLSDPVIRQQSRLGLGVVNPRLYDAESVESIVSRAEEALEFLPADRIFLNPDCGFASFANRPVNQEEMIIEKMDHLVKASQILRTRHGRGK